MKKFIQTTLGKVCIVTGAILLLGCLILGGLAIWYYAQPKFQDVTVELGTQELTVTPFLTQHGKAEKASFVTDWKTLPLDKAGTVDITLSQDGKKETVKLTIADTVAPTAAFQDLLVYANELPDAEDFVVEASDLDTLSYSFETVTVVPDDYADTTVNVVVSDASGNTVTGQCTLSFIWIHQAATFPLGETLTREDVLLFPEKDGGSIDQADIDAINNGGSGRFTIDSTIGDMTQTCVVTVLDIVGPALVMKDLTVLQGQSVAPEDFIESVTDSSEPVDLQFVTAPVTDTPGTFTVQIRATDAEGNETVAEAALTVEADTEGPVFEEMAALYVEKASTPDYKAGVTVTDNSGETVEFTVDTSAVDTSRGGVYYITYTATDKAGNETKYRRKVEVIHNQEDTRNLVKEMAERAARNYGTGVEDLRDFVRNSIGYSSGGESAWGGDDPVWYGFTQFTGNCYVHAVCLEALLEYYGYTYQEIYVTHMEGGRPSHYWVIVDMGGYWRHVDATPGVSHSKYSLMTDEQRYETLYRSDYGQRDWDRSLWPACE